MPGSEKVLKNRERAANRAAGIGDKDGKLSHLTKKAEVMIRCTVCSSEIRATKRNIEAGSHASSRHSDKTFQECFPGADLPEGHAAAGAKASGEKKKVDIDRIRAEAAARKHIEEGGLSPAQKAALKAEEAGGDGVTDGTVFSGMTLDGKPAAAAPVVKKKKKVEDLSFLDAAVEAGKKKGGGKKK